MQYKNIADKQILKYLKYMFRGNQCLTQYASQGKIKLFYAWKKYDAHRHFRNPILNKKFR